MRRHRPGSVVRRGPSRERPTATGGGSSVPPFGSAWDAGWWAWARRSPDQPCHRATTRGPPSRTRRSDAAGTMRLGLQVPSFTYPGGTAGIRTTLTEIAQAAEAAGFASLWLMDHWFQLPEQSGWGGPDQPM